MKKTAFVIVLAVCIGIVAAAVVSVPALYAAPHYVNMTDAEAYAQARVATKQSVDDCFAAGGYQWVFGGGGCYMPTGINNDYPRTAVPWTPPIPNDMYVWAQAAAVALALLAFCTPFVVIGTGIHLFWKPF